MVRGWVMAAALAVLAAGCVQPPAEVGTDELRRQAEAGSAAAAEQFGERAMFYGVDGRIDNTAALDAFTRAAAGGDAKAAGFKALLLRDYPLPDGNDPDLAASEFAAVRPQLLAMKDDPAANYLLAVFEGPGGSDWRERLEFAEERFYYPASVRLAKQDGSERSRLRRLRRAADHGCAEAMYLIGDRENLARAARRGYPAALPLEQAAAAGVAIARLHLAADSALPFQQRKRLYALAFTSGIGGGEFAKFLLDQGDRGHAALLEPEAVPELYYSLLALGPLTARERAFPNDYQRSAWYGTTDPEALEKFFESNRDRQSEPAYWLAYALAASRAGRGECALYGARRYRSAGGDGDAAQFIEDHARTMVSGGDAGLPGNAQLLELARTFFVESGSPQPFYDVVLGQMLTDDEDQLNSEVKPVEPPPEPVAVRP